MLSSVAALMPCREQLVEQFPLREGSFNKVPKIATEADA